MVTQLRHREVKCLVMVIKKGRAEIWIHVCVDPKAMLSLTYQISVDVSVMENHP